MITSIEKVLLKASDNGSTAISEENLKSQLHGSLKGMDELLRQGKVCCYNKNGTYFFSLRSYAEKEEAIAYKLCEMLNNKPAFVSDVVIDSCLSRFDPLGKLHEKQREAVFMSVRNSIMCFIGGAGTGKTTTVLRMYQTLHALYPTAKFLFCAPTGKAARRMKEALEITGLDAYTLHKKLGITADNLTPLQLDADYIFIDEGALSDINVMYALFKAVRSTTRIIFIGDDCQLPSVGPGAVLRDFIASGIVPVTMLTQTFRQQGGSPIISNATNIRKGIEKLEVKVGTCNDPGDFIITRPSELTNRNMSNSDFLIGSYLHKAAEVGIDNVALLTPYKQEKFNTGADYLNKLIQKKVNTSTKAIDYYGNTFLLGDKIMQTKNRIECTNGDTGEIVAVYKNGIVAKYIDGIVEYKKSELDQLTLAYALSVHKSQGAEYQSVISCMLNEYGIMQQRNLLYTAVTRAKQDFILLADDKALKKAINTDATALRCTLLAEKIRDVAAYYGMYAA